MADNFIFIDRDTSFNGTITAEEVVVEGVVKGDITASEKVLVKHGAVINGNIVTGQLLFEEGGQHNGMIRLGRPKPEESISEEEDKLSVSENDEPSNDGDKPLARESEEGEDQKRLW